MSDEQINPAVRLAVSGMPKSDRDLNLGPSVRLVNFDIPAVHKALVGPVEAPTVRLAHCDGAQGDCSLKGEKGVPQILAQDAPALLVSYVYVNPFLKNRDAYCYRDWVLDSGAFSAHQCGTPIDLNQYIDFCSKVLAEDNTLTEVFALDVIPQEQTALAVSQAAEQSIKNCEEMWRQGVEAIPCYHRGEDEQHLYHIAKHYPKIALGGIASDRSFSQDMKFRWLEQCFARVWPKKIHGFGVSGEQMVFGLPFHSVDATNWELAPCAFGHWAKFGAMSVRGSNQDLRSQVKHYMSMEARARVRWKKEMELLERLSPSKRKAPAPSIRLAAVSGTNSGRQGALLKPSFTLMATELKPKKKRVKKEEKPVEQEMVAPPPVVAEPSVKNEKKESEKKTTGQLDDKWVNYWKTRL